MMDNQFNLTAANWLFYVTDPAIGINTLRRMSNNKEMLELILGEVFKERFIHQPDTIDKADSLLKELKAFENDAVSNDFFSKVRSFINESEWLALFIPSGIDTSIDDVLCDPDLLGYLLNSSSKLKGLIFQLAAPPPAAFTILEIHPALRTALNEVVHWPGILLWQPGGDTIFLPVGSKDLIEIDVETRLLWMFTQLNENGHLDLAKLKIKYRNEFPEVYENELSTAHILHLSDLHIGSQSANRRMPRLKELIVNIVEQLGEHGKIIPVISGDLMDNPSEKHIVSVRKFWDFISDLGTEEPLLVLGNHDVRKDGNINENYLTSIGFPATKVVWHDDVGLGIVCVNSVQQGKLDRGSIGEAQLSEIALELQRQTDEDYQLVVLLHHHPIVHKAPEDLSVPFYETTVGKTIEAPLDLEDAALLLDFVNENPVSAILHGHGHIPFLDLFAQDIPVIGCGSSIGHISESDGGIYFSVNIVSINKKNRKTTSRILAFRKPEGGLLDSVWHEMVFQSKTG